MIIIIIVPSVQRIKKGLKIIHFLICMKNVHIYLFIRKLKNVHKTTFQKLLDLTRISDQLCLQSKIQVIFS